MNGYLNDYTCQQDPLPLTSSGLHLVERSHLCPNISDRLIGVSQTLIQSSTSTDLRVDDERDHSGLEFRTSGLAGSLALSLEGRADAFWDLFRLGYRDSYKFLLGLHSKERGFSFL